MIRLYKKFACWFGWHSHSFLRKCHGFIPTTHDGCSQHAICRWCEYEGMIDGQGNLF